VLALGQSSFFLLIRSDGRWLVSSSMTAAPRHARPSRPPGRRWHRVVRWISVLGLIAIGLLCAYELGPASVGGPNTYVITRGTSMLPTIKPYSLVVIRQQSSYRVGEIVAYHNRDLHAVVLHRIIARDGSKYVFKGDNNQFPDLYEASATDLVGEKVVYSPSAGRVLLGLRNPLIGAVLFGGFAIWVLSDIGAGKEAKHGRTRRARRAGRAADEELHQN
jgi:signal peptidase I